MINYDYNKLRGRIKEKFGTQENFAEALEIGTVSLSKRLNCSLEFSQNEINRAVDVLDIPREQIPDYFFTIRV